MRICPHSSLRGKKNHLPVSFTNSKHMTSKGQVITSLKSKTQLSSSSSAASSSSFHSPVTLKMGQDHQDRYDRVCAMPCNLIDVITEDVKIYKDITALSIATYETKLLHLSFVPRPGIPSVTPVN